MCDACGQDAGVIQPHSENYSAPYGDHIGEHGLCFTCHMMIHCRFRSPAAWQAYRAAIREGWIFKPFHCKAFHAFAGAFLGPALPPAARMRAQTGDTLLDQIEAAGTPQSAG